MIIQTNKSIKIAYEDQFFPLLPPLSLQAGQDDPEVSVSNF